MIKLRKENNMPKRFDYVIIYNNLYLREDTVNQYRLYMEQTTKADISDVYLGYFNSIILKSDNPLDDVMRVSEGSENSTTVEQRISLLKKLVDSGKIPQSVIDKIRKPNAIEQ
jgi:hypothetical protein